MDQIVTLKAIVSYQFYANGYSFALLTCTSLLHCSLLSITCSIVKVLQNYQDGPQNSTDVSKGKAIPLQAWRGPEAEVPRFQDNRHMMVVRLSALRTGRFLPPRNIAGTHFCWRQSKPQGHSAAWRIMSMNNFSNTTTLQSGPKKCVHSLLINIFGINSNEISISGWECNIMFSQQMTQALL
jgi:hypothetical protein